MRIGMLIIAELRIDDCKDAELTVLPMASLMSNQPRMENKTSVKQPQVPLGNLHDIVCNVE